MPKSIRKVLYCSETEVSLKKNEINVDVIEMPSSRRFTGLAEGICVKKIRVKFCHIRSNRKYVPHESIIKVKKSGRPRKT